MLTDLGAYLHQMFIKMLDGFLKTYKSLKLKEIQELVRYITQKLKNINDWKKRMTKKRKHANLWLSINKLIPSNHFSVATGLWLCKLKCLKPKKLYYKAHQNL